MEDIIEVYDIEPHATAVVDVGLIGKSKSIDQYISTIMDKLLVEHKLIQTELSEFSDLKNVSAYNFRNKTGSFSLKLSKIQAILDRMKHLDIIFKSVADFITITEHLEQDNQIVESAQSAHRKYCIQQILLQRDHKDDSDDLDSIDGSNIYDNSHNTDKASTLTQTDDYETVLIKTTLEPDLISNHQKYAKDRQNHLMHDSVSNNSEDSKLDDLNEDKSIV